MVKNRDHFTITTIHDDRSVTVTGRSGTVRLPAGYVARACGVGVCPDQSRHPRPHRRHRPPLPRRSHRHPRRLHPHDPRTTAPTTPTSSPTAPRPPSTCSPRAWHGTGSTTPPWLADSSSRPTRRRCRCGRRCRRPGSAGPSTRRRTARDRNPAPPSLDPLSSRSTSGACGGGSPRSSTERPSSGPPNGPSVETPPASNADHPPLPRRRHIEAVAPNAGSARIGVRDIARRGW